MNIDADGRSNEEMKILLEGLKLECEHLKFSNKFEQSPFSYLEAFANQHQHVYSISLWCHHLPPPVTFSQITKLELELYSLRKSLKPLELLVNLVELEIQSNIEGCWIVHKPVNLMRLKKFTF